MLNKVFLIGRLTRDPESSSTQSGVAYCKFSIAIDRFTKGKDGESLTDFIRIVCWRRLAEICSQYLKKGKLVCVEGRLQIDLFEKNGEKREFSEVTALNVQMLDRGFQIDSNQP